MRSLTVWRSAPPEIPVTSSVAFLSNSVAVTISWLAIRPSPMTAFSDQLGRASSPSVAASVVPAVVVPLVEVQE
jgi:hypothetical protein